MKTNKNPQKAAKRKSNAHAESGPGLQVTRGYGTAQEILRFDLNFTLWYNGAQFSRSESVLAWEGGGGGEESWLPDAPRVSQTFGRMRHIQKKCNTSAVVAVRCV